LEQTKAGQHHSDQGHLLAQVLGFHFCASDALSEVGKLFMGRSSSIRGRFRATLGKVPQFSFRLERTRRINFFLTLLRINYSDGEVRSFGGVFGPTSACGNNIPVERVYTHLRRPFARTLSIPTGSKLKNHCTPSTKGTTNVWNEGYVRRGQPPITTR